MLDNNMKVDCRCRGKFRNDNLKPLVGDRVIVNGEVIEEIKDRKNELVRPLVANIDKLFIVISVTKPKFSSYLLDKFLIISIKNKIEPVIIFTKYDLLNFKEKKQIKKYIKYYKKLGFKVFINSEIRKIKQEFKDSTIALMGQTGAGKSTLINKFDKTLNLETNEISNALGRGKHTTRVVELFEINNGFVVDTPGFSSFELYNISKFDVRDSFVEFRKNCKYKTCMHINEDGCIVKDNINNNIEKERYNNYIKLVGEVK